MFRLKHKSSAEMSRICLLGKDGFFSKERGALIYTPLSNYFSFAKIALNVPDGLITAEAFLVSAK